MVIPHQGDRKKRYKASRPLELWATPQSEKELKHAQAFTLEDGSSEAVNLAAARYIHATWNDGTHRLTWRRELENS
jgi:hypothetical protein